MPINARCSVANCDILSSAPLPWAGDTPPTLPLEQRRWGLFVAEKKECSLPSPPLRVPHLQKWANPQGLWGPPCPRSAPSTRPILFGREVSPGDQILQRTSLRMKWFLVSEAPELVGFSQVLSYWEQLESWGLHKVYLEREGHRKQGLLWW